MINDFPPLLSPAAFTADFKPHIFIFFYLAHL